MKYEDRTSEQHINELAELRRRVNELSASRVQLEAELSELKEWVNTLDTFVVKCDRDGSILFCNDGAFKAVGRTPQEIVGTHFPDSKWWLHSEAERAKIVTCFEKAKEGLSTRIETTFESADGARVPIIFNCQPVMDGRGDARYISLEGKTIIEETRLRKELEKEIRDHKQAEAALRESEEKYSTLVENSPTGIYIDQDRRITFCNDKFAEIYRYTRDELERMESWKLVHTEDRSLTNEIREKRLKGESVPTEYEAKGLTKDGETIWVTRRNARIEYEGRPAILGNIVDVTERKRAEEHVRILTQQLIQAEESERQRIARDLHDHVAQDLSSAKIACETIFDDQQEVPSELRQRVSILSKILQGAISAVRDLAYDLRPLSLDQLGLVRTVFQYCEEFSEKNALKIDFYSAGMDDLRLGFDTEINLYRLIQESLTNVWKHADADSVAIRLVASFPNIILRIEDDGKGFDVENRLISALNEKRMGLRSMEERVRLLNGKMRIQSRRMLGTKIFIEIPLTEAMNDQEEKYINC